MIGLKWGNLEESPWMLFAIPVKEDKWEQIPAVIHKDGTCRIQTVYSRRKRSILRSN